MYIYIYKYTYINIAAHRELHVFTFNHSNYYQFYHSPYILHGYDTF